MLEVKLAYYPKQQAILSESPFGVPELSCHKIYDNPLANKQILRVDMLEAVRGIFGDNCMHYRDHLYNVIAGNTKDFNESIHSYYNKFPVFREYVNNEFYFGDTSRPIAERIKEQILDLIRSKLAYVNDYCQQSGGKYLIYTHCYLYYCYVVGVKVPVFDGGITIC